MDIFTALRDDHDKQRHLMKVLVETEGNSPSRAMFFSDLKDQLEAHAVAEERGGHVGEDRSRERSGDLVTDEARMVDVVRVVDHIA